MAQTLPDLAQTIQAKIDLDEQPLHEEKTMAYRHHQKDGQRAYGMNTGDKGDIREPIDPITLSCLEKTIILAALQLYRTHPLVRHDADVDACCKRFEQLADFSTAQHKVV